MCRLRSLHLVEKRGILWHVFLFIGVETKHHKFLGERREPVLWSSLHGMFWSLEALKLVSRCISGKLKGFPVANQKKNHKKQKGMSLPRNPIWSFNFELLSSLLGFCLKPVKIKIVPQNMVSSSVPRVRIHAAVVSTHTNANYWLLSPNIHIGSVAHCKTGSESLLSFASVWSAGKTHLVIKHLPAVCLLATRFTSACASANVQQSSAELLWNLSESFLRSLPACEGQHIHIIKDSTTPRGHREWFMIRGDLGFE